MIVGCSDGAVYVWQMETGHLDRVLHGLFAPRCFNLPNVIRIILISFNFLDSSNFYFFRASEIFIVFSILVHFLNYMQNSREQIIPSFRHYCGRGALRMRRKHYSGSRRIRRRR